MRDKIDALTAARDVKLRKLQKTEHDIRDKEASLQKLKSEYQATTEQIADLKHRIALVSAKCDRATRITDQLVDERRRWEAEITNFDTEARSTIGDCLIAAAFLAYIGYFDEYTRQQVLTPRWLDCLRRKSVPVREHLSVMDFLGLPKLRLEWEASGLPKDRLCVENATIMHRCSRYTMLIDPAGMAAQFLQAYYAKDKVDKASFSRPGYLKQLENAVRFGYPIILEDAEFLDPAVMPLLSQEFHRNGGRFITRIGAQDVDLSPTFRLFLVTRDRDYQPSPDIAGQVCLVNFTMTLSSLQSQCLHRLLLQERPEVDSKRTALMQAQGEFQLRLRLLEQNLLTLIAQSEGSLLDNDEAIQSLQKLKLETKGIQESIEDSDASMQLIEQTEGLYRPVATLAAQTFFALRQLSELSTFYRYDIHFIFRVVDAALAALPPKQTGRPTDARGHGVAAATSEETHRIDLLGRIVLSLVHKRVSRGMFRGDQLVLDLRLAQLRSAMLAEMAARGGRPLEGRNDPKCVTEDEWGWLLEGLHASGAAGEASAAAPRPDSDLPPILQKEGLLRVGPQGRAALKTLLAKAAFRELRESLTNSRLTAVWSAVLLSGSPIDAVGTLPASCFPPGASLTRRTALLTFLLYYVRRDAFMEAVLRLLHRFFDGEEAASGTPPPAGDSASDAARYFTVSSQSVSEVISELTLSTPLLMLSDTSYDPSTQVEHAAGPLNARLRTVAMGSKEGTESADRYLEVAIQTGGWVLLKNVHLARAYMDRLEKRLHFETLENRVHRDFRLFMTADSSVAAPAGEADARAQRAASALPINLLEKSVLVVYEPPPGLRSSLLQTYGALRHKAADVVGPVDDHEPTPMQRLYLAAAWMHAVIVERLFYVPLGWSEAYEYSDTEFVRTLQAVRAWTQPGGAGGPPTISWLALQAIVVATIYGGKVDNGFDQHVLEILARRMLNPSVFDADLQPVKGAVAAAELPPPLPGTASAFSDVMHWVHALPEGYSS
ncbi:dynein heavy chain 1, cytosolic, partial [Strigomonas culicis]